MAIMMITMPRLGDDNNGNTDNDVNITTLGDPPLNKGVDVKIANDV